jgi:hypothetical protein
VNLFFRGCDESRETRNLLATDLSNSHLTKPVERPGRSTMTVVRAGRSHMVELDKVADESSLVP